MPQSITQNYVRYAALAWLLMLVVGALWAVVSGSEPVRAPQRAMQQQTETLPPIRQTSLEAPLPAPRDAGHGSFHGAGGGGFHGGPIVPADAPLMQQSSADAAAKSNGCITCHTNVGDMHNVATVNLGCVDCHGGDPCATTKEAAHVKPKFRNAWYSSANPVRSYALLNHEEPEFIRFVNPGDLRVAHIACGQCHSHEVLAVKKSMMTHGCMLWGSALYNNGSVPDKAARFGESYSMHGAPQRMYTVPAPTEAEMRQQAILPYLDPLMKFEVSQPGNVLRTFERGGRFRAEVGIPERLEEAGRPRERLSDRGLGTQNRTDPVFVGLQKTRLFDPTLNFMGTNDHPGDYRSSGCSGCHVLYANDRSPVHSGPFAKYGNRGLAASQVDDFVKFVDPTIPKDEPGHPVAHQFTSRIPTSQCIVCHVHPGTNVMNSYLGFMWWDNETDGELMYPSKQKYPTAEERVAMSMSNPEEASQQGNWSDPEFLANVSDLNTSARHTQFADFHGHGWVFRAVYKKDRAGRLLDHRGELVSELSTEKLLDAMAPPNELEKACGKQRDDTPVHLMDIHLERGMHCVDCHFYQDVHGNTKLYGEVRAAIEIQCADCHGTADASIKDRLVHGDGCMPTSGPAARQGGLNLARLNTPFGKKRFEVVDGKLWQRSMVEKDRQWEVVQTADTVNPSSEHYNVKSHMAKTVRFEEDGKLHWGGPPRGKCAHDNKAMSCIACHSSWNPSCFGCHLPQKANMKMPELHNNGDVSRNHVAYNFQTLRDDVYMLAKDGDATGNRIGPARSSCAVHVGSYNGNRESIYVQQQTVSAEGAAGIAFSTNVPHTVRGGHGTTYDGLGDMSGTHETKMCTDCHVSKADDNNALMAQLLMQGTNYVNFIGKYCWVAAGEHGFEGVVVTETKEPQAVIGSNLQRLAFPDYYQEHLNHDRQLQHAHEHPGKDISDQVLQPFTKHEILSLQARGEFLYAACGAGGLRVFDIAFIDHKGFSERIVSAPVSPKGQRLVVKTKYATSVASPTTIAADPTRAHREANQEQPIHPLYGYIYVTDREEGLILVPAATLLDGNPLNNFLEREVTFSPAGILKGAKSVTIAGTYAYVCCDRGLVVVSLENPKQPCVVHVVDEQVLHCPTAVQVQFRYAYVCDHEGVKVLDVTDLAHPVPVAALALEEAHNIYLARTYAYVAAGKQGLVVLDIKQPAAPKIDQVFNAGGCIDDLHDVKLGITYVSEFAYLADGKNGLRVVQLTSAETLGNDGFSPRPTPQLIATYKIPKGGHALAVSKGVDRDRAVDESGNQIAVFGRVGARPLNRVEQQKMYLRDGSLYQVSDNPFDLEVYVPPREVLQSRRHNPALRR